MSESQRPSHPFLESLEPYTPPDLAASAARSGVEPSELLRLSSNENQFGPSPRVGVALSDYSQYAYYPDYTTLKEALAGYTGVAPEQIALSNGADEMIDLLIRLLVEPGQAVVICPPTFDMYRFFARVNRCRVLAVPRTAGFELDLSAIEAAVLESEGAARLLIIASPGNPHGLPTPLQEVERLLALPLFVAIDEAYTEFGGDSAVALLDAHANLIVIRTFSKWAGLAGLRLGYGLAHRELARWIGRIHAPYNVNAAAVAAALATLEDLDTVQANVRVLIKERERMRDALARLPWLEPLPSQGNFVLCRVQGGTGRDVADALATKGILVQAFSAPTMASYVRITIGRPEQNDAVLWALSQRNPVSPEGGGSVGGAP